MDQQNACGAEPRIGAVQCMSPAGLHTVRYTQWGDPHNPRVLICVHGLTRTGRDFDRLARAMSGAFRVVCPDVAGRGRSDWLRDGRHYVIPQYVSDMVTLIARLDVPSVSWVGTSMGGLIGMGLAGLPDSPIERLVINDVGPRLDPEAVARIGSYVGRPLSFADEEAAVAYVREIAAGFGMRDDEEWREITRTVIKRDGDAFVFHYDPAISYNFKGLDAAAISSSEQAMWRLYDAIVCPTLLVRGELSDLLSAETAREMGERGPRARLVSVPDVGHAPMFFDPAQIEVLRAFLLERG
jgi:pimeloyl-ACP methyl ester carboxylesterase